jgi:hypothetical protein
VPYVASLSGLSILDFPFGLYRLFAEYSAIDTDVSKDCDSVASTTDINQQVFSSDYHLPAEIS